MKNTKLISPEFKQLINDFENALTKENSSENNTNEHTSYSKEFFAFAEQRDIMTLKEVNQSVVDRYIVFLEQERINERRGGMLSTGTVNKQKLAIRKLWKYFETEGIKTNTIRLKQKKSNDQKESTVLTHKEIEQLYSVCDNSALGYRDKAMLAIYYGCGLRKSEGLRLLLTDFDFAKGRIHVRKSKNNRERYVMMSPKVQEQIEEYIYSYRDFYLAEQSGYEQLFIGERGTPVSIETLAKRIETLWQRLKDRYGNDKHIGLHTLRHSLGTHLYMAKMDLETIALMLGHRTLEATQIYIHAANKLKQ